VRVRCGPAGISANDDTAAAALVNPPCPGAERAGHSISYQKHLDARGNLWSDNTRDVDLCCICGLFEERYRRVSSDKPRCTKKENVG
jgi:hypothetical protein